ncbi:MAG: TIGR04002 family protein [Clostridiales bacterium GWF2_38_85]|nr:MAG: TIGR04002 family protein [Clostridiales bacterium GWF2_38_85]HBL83745.1 TIGR04002 family protein [Clostridiales bacterium]
MQKKHLKYLVLTALFAAIIYVATGVLPRIDIGPGGYIHIGDAFIYLAACFLPLPYAMAAAAIGGSMADILSPYIVYAPFTFVIKALLVIAFTNKSNKLMTLRSFVATIIAIPITVIGYYFAEAIIYGSFYTPLVNIVPSIGQAAASMLIYILIAFALDKAKLKYKLMQ